MIRVLALLLSLASPARTQTFPFDVKDPQEQETLEYLDQEIRRNGQFSVTCPTGQDIIAPQVVGGKIISGTCGAPSAGSSTVTVTSPLSGNGSVGSPVALTGAIPQSLINLSTVPVAGSCTLPNVVRATNAGGAPTCAQPTDTTGNSATTTALKTAPTTAGSGFLSRGIDTSGNAQLAAVDATATSGSTNPVQSGAMFTALSGKQATGNYLTGLTSDVTASGPGSVSATVNSASASGGFAVTGPQTNKSSVTVQGNAFSVGGSSFTVGGGSATVAYQMQVGNLNVQNVKSGTQCLHADASGNVTGTGSDCGAGGGGSSLLIATGTLTSPATYYPLRGSLTFDSAYFTGTDSATLNTTFLSLKTAVGQLASSTTAILNTTQNTFGVAIATLTVNLGAGNRALVCFHGAANPGTGVNASLTVGALVDGQYVDGETATHGFSAARTDSSGISMIHPISFCHMVSTQTAGSHSFGFTFGNSSGGGGALECASSGLETPSCQFGVYEWPTNGFIVATQGAIGFQTDRFESQVNGSKTSFTLSQVPASTAAISVVLDGLLQSSASDYTYTSPTTITMTTAPAANSSSFWVNYAINTSTLPAAMLVNSTDTVSGHKTMTAGLTSNSVDISSFSCNDLTGFVGGAYSAGQLGTGISTVTLTASSFTVVFEGSFCDNTSCSNSSDEAISLLADGGFPAADSGLGLHALSATVACQHGGAPSGNGGSAYIVCRRQFRLANGTHSFAATVQNFTDNNSGVVRCNPNATCRLCVWSGLLP